MDQKELRESENRCIQEQAPACTAACPIHIDVRTMLAQVSKGDFSAGLKILRKTLPFPGILSRICDQPCRPVCKRAEAGAPLAIAAIERACVEWGGPGDKITTLPRKAKKVAIVGAGLSGLTAAFDLIRKGYETVVYEAEGQPGGTLWSYPQEILPWPVIVQEVEAVIRLGVEIRLNSAVGKVGKNGRQPPLSLLCEQFDAVYLALGSQSTETYDLALDDNGRVRVHPATCMTSQDGIFAGGGFLCAQAPDLARRPGQLSVADEEQFSRAEDLSTAQDSSQIRHLRSPIQSVSDGRRAATSIDRYLQRVSLTAARANEGSYPTRLYTSTHGLPPQAEVPCTNPHTGYSQAEARQEAQRCIQCQCLECVKVCEYLKSYSGYPKKYIREIYNNLSIVMGTRYSNQMINSCSLCGLCVEVCPEDVDMGVICKEARRIMVEQKRMPPSAHDFALRDLAFSNGPAFTLARHAPRTNASQYIFFPGCQLSASAPAYVEKIYAYLAQKLGEQAPDGQAGVGLMLRCCGAPAEWAGRTDLFQAAARDFLADYEQMGRPRLILACSSCYQVFKTHFPDLAIQSLWEVLQELGLPGGVRAGSAGTRLVIHDPCTTRAETALQDSVRALVQSLGYELEELPLNRQHTECCSYGGLQWLANPALARQAVQRRIQASPNTYLTYCAMCRDFFARQGKPALHLLDLLLGEDLCALAERPDPGFSQRHENRRRLKKHLLKTVWSEDDMDENQPAQAIALNIPAEVRQLLEERLILIEDVQQVIEYAERTRKRIKNKQNDHCLAYYKPGNVTYWVEYAPDGAAYRIYNAYSHRMEIGTEAHK